MSEYMQNLYTRRVYNQSCDIMFLVTESLHTAGLQSAKSCHIMFLVIEI